jgi:hypothetical protein
MLGVFVGVLLMLAQNQGQEERNPRQEDAKVAQQADEEVSRLWMEHPERRRM